MPAKLSTTVAKIALVPNKVNAGLIREYHRYLREWRIRAPPEQRP
ncbi:hypothetical protein [Candidatus Nitrososphaera gargensis]|nr:hypothetical protein [Candidatus Nitrososphaera gargensis]